MSGRLTVSKLPECAWLHPHGTGITCACYHVRLLYGCWGMQAQVLCVPSTLTTKPSAQCSIHTCFNILELDSMVCYMLTYHKINRNKIERIEINFIGQPRVTDMWVIFTAPPPTIGGGMTSYTCVFSSGNPAGLTKIFTSLLSSRWNDSIILSVLISHRTGLEIIKLSGGLCMSLVSFSPAILSATMGFLIKIQGSEKSRIKTTMVADEDA